MRLVVFSVPIAFLVVTATLASEPGQPLDCSDWVFLEPGLSCSELISSDECANATDTFCQTQVASKVVDNAGRLLILRRVEVLSSCWNNGPLREKWGILRWGSSGLEVLGIIEERCGDPGGTQDRVDFDGGIVFDDKNGRLIFRVTHDCAVDTSGPNDPSCNYEGGTQVVAIAGFGTTFEILQTYEPSSTLSFRVPYMPEGFQSADWFDTYYGDLASVGDWGQAQPLQCGYPATTPSVGDYLTVADTVPTPGANQGFYYVTAVTHQSQKRYGRQSSGGILSGRDANRLPACLP